MGLSFYYGFPGRSDDKDSACNAGDPGLIPGSGSSSRGGHGNPLQYSCLENPMDRGTWQAIVHEVAKNWTQLNPEEGAYFVPWSDAEGRSSDSP